MNKLFAKTSIFVIIVSILSMIGLFGFIDFAEAEDGAAIKIEPPLKWEYIHEIIDAILRFIWHLSWIIVPLLIIIGAFYIMSSGGDEKRLSTGKKIIIYAIIGFLVILFSRGILGIIRGILGVEIGAE